MRSTKEELRSRAIVAARAEFSAHGLAGARIDRIASSARVSKERLYAHFVDKLSLFRLVLDADSEEFFAPLKATPDDLPGFVGAMFDRSHDHVEHLRMFTWARLAGEPFTSTHASDIVDHLREVVAEAQQKGLVDLRWDPRDAVSLMFTMAFAWLQTPDPAGGVYGRGDVAHDRMMAVDATRRLLAPTP